MDVADENDSDTISLLLCDVYDAVLKVGNRNRIFRFDVKHSLQTDIKNFEIKIQSLCNACHFETVFSYIISELVCNIEQHANVEFGYGMMYYCQEKKMLTLAIADGGISIYGSFIKNGKYIENVGNSDSKALYLAQNGFSTKNLPDAENRGYGISTSSRLIVEGLNGEFAILSGNALFLRNTNEKFIVELPDDVLWPGTMVIMNIPLDYKKINIYEYIS